MDRIFSRVLLVFIFTFGVVSSTAQSRPIGAPVITPELAQVTKKAGLIFTGTVVSVAPIRASGSDAISTVEVTFQVEQAIR